MAYTLTEKDCLFIQRMTWKSCKRFGVPYRYMDDTVQDVIVRALVWAKGHDTTRCPFIPRLLQSLDHIVIRCIARRTRSYLVKPVEVFYRPELPDATYEEKAFDEIDGLEQVERLAKVLTERQKDILDMYIRGNTYVCIGVLLGLTRQRVHQIVQEIRTRAIEFFYLEGSAVA